jgi:hypothetical protein
LFAGVIVETPAVFLVAPERIRAAKAEAARVRMILVGIHTATLSWLEDKGGKIKSWLGAPAFSRQPPRLAGASPRLAISAYSSLSVPETWPS